MEEKHPCIHDIGDELPITKAVLRYRKTGEHRFHTPGHKGRGHFLPEILDIKCDVTETADLDNLLNPTGCINLSEEEVNKAVKGKKTFFVTSGATTAILAAVNAVKGKGKIAILRSSHISVFSAIEISGIEPVIINNVDEFGNSLKLTEEMLEEVLMDKSVGVVLLTRPNYLGDAFDIDKIGGRIKKSGKLLIIDASHGTHFVFSDVFPKSTEKYADITIFSAHKTLPSLTGAALLTVNSETLIDSVDKSYHLFHTTSPNYLVMMSLEYGIYMYSHYSEGIEDLKKNVDNMKKTLIASDVSLYDNDDFSRLVVDAKQMGISGKELDMRLNEKGIFAEFSSMDKVVFILTIEDEKEDITALTQNLIISAEQCGKVSVKQYKFPKTFRAMPYLKAVSSDYEIIDAENALGRIAAKNFGIYPPAMPIALSGEVITQEIIDYLDKPLDFYGTEKGKLRVVKG